MTNTKGSFDKHILEKTSLLKGVRKIASSICDFLIALLSMKGHLPIFLSSHLDSYLENSVFFQRKGMQE